MRGLTVPDGPPSLTGLSTSRRSVGRSSFSAEGSGLADEDKLHEVNRESSSQVGRDCIPERTVLMPGLRAMVLSQERLEHKIEVWMAGIMERQDKQVKMMRRALHALGEEEVDVEQPDARGGCGTKPMMVKPVSKPVPSMAPWPFDESPSGALSPAGLFVEIRHDSEGGNSDAGDGGTTHGACSSSALAHSLKPCPSKGGLGGPGEGSRGSWLHAAPFTYGIASEEERIPSARAMLPKVDEEDTRCSAVSGADQGMVRADKESMIKARSILLGMKAVTANPVGRKWIDDKMREIVKHAPTMGPQRCLAAIVEHSYFDSVCAIMILFNSVLIGWEVEHLTSHDIETTTMKLLGLLCGTFFFVELLFRIGAQGRLFFRGDDRSWNVFDTVMVAFSLFEFVAYFAVGGGQGPKGFGSGMKAFKMMRIARIFRVFRFFRELSLLAVMIVDSLRSLMWAMTMLVIILYVFAICFTQGATEYLFGDDVDPAHAETVRRHFGHISNSVYYLVLSMLGGISWVEITDSLVNISSVFMVFLFFFYISFTLLAVLNIITGVFVDNAVETAKTQRDFLVQKEVQLREKYRTELLELFCKMDSDGSGFLTLDEVELCVQDPRMRGYFSALGLDTQDTTRLFRLIDKDGSGEVELEEFLDGCLRLKGEARSIDMHAVMYECKRLGRRMDELVQFVGLTGSRFSRLSCA